MGFGESGLPVMPGLKQRLADAAGRAEYGPVDGVPELRRGAAGYWQRRSLPTDPEFVIAGPGSKPLLYALLHAIDGPIALPRPSWVSYAAHAALLGCPVTLLPTPAGQGGVPDPAQLDAAARDAERSGRPLRAVILTLPDNPTGTLASSDTIAKLCEVAERHDLILISDEIYRDLVHGDAASFLSPAALLPERTVITSGLSKSLSLGGWRIGVARLPHCAVGRRLHRHVTAIASEIWSAAAQPIQWAAAWALTEPPEVLERVALSRRLHAAVAQSTSRILAGAGVDHPRPAGAFYLYPNFDAHREQLAEAWSITTGSDLATVLMERFGVATLPAVAFGESDDTLALRLATSRLYGDTDSQAEAALRHPAPATLPWIAEPLQTLHVALTTLLSERA